MCWGVLAGTPPLGNPDARSRVLLSAQDLAPDGLGSTYFVANSRVHVLRPDGTAAPIAGTPPEDGVVCGGEPGPALDTCMFAVEVAVQRADWTGGAAAGAGLLQAPVGAEGRNASVGEQVPSSDVVRYMYVGDTAHSRLWRIDLEYGIAEVAAGSGQWSYCGGERGPATAACLDPFSLAVDAHGNVFIGDVANARILVMWAQNNTIETIAGNGQKAYCGGDTRLPAKAACIVPVSITVSRGGDVYIADSDSRVYSLRMSDRTLVTVVGGTAHGDACDTTTIAWNSSCVLPTGVALSPTDDLYVVLDSVRVFRWSPVHRALLHVAGQATFPCTGGGAAATSACLLIARLEVDHHGDLLLTDNGGETARIVRVDMHTMQLELVAGTSPGAPCSSMTLSATDACMVPTAVAVNEMGDLLIADAESFRVRRLHSSNATVSLVAGRGAATDCGAAGDNAVDACFTPEDIATGPVGAVYVADAEQARVYRVDANGAFRTVAGNGMQLCDNMLDEPAPAALACLGSPSAIAVSGDVGLYIANTRAVVHFLNFSTGLLVRFAGNGLPPSDQVCGVPVDGLPARDACVLAQDLAVGPEADVYMLHVPNSFNISILKVSARTGATTHVVSGPSQESDCNGATAAMHLCVWPGSLSLDSQRRVAYVAGFPTQPIYEVNLLTGALRALPALATVSPCSYSLLGCLYMIDVAVDSYGNLIVASPDHRQVYVLRMGTAIACPPGNACPCGAPVACTNASSFCPGNGIAPLAAAEGYYSVPENHGMARTGQLQCPVGSFCRHGIRTPCPPGTLGRWRGQAWPSACMPCPAGTYAAVSSSAAAAGCLPCPAGSVAPAPGAAACAWCPAGTFQSGTKCAPCPAGHYSLGGSTACAVIPPGLAANTWDNFAALSIDEREASPDSGAGSSSSPAWRALILGPIIFAGAIPTAMLLFVRCTPRQPSWHSRVKVWVRSVDVFGLAHRVQQGESPVMRRTTLGGGVTLVTLSCIMAFAALLVSEYAVNNAEQQPLVLAPVSDGYAAAASHVVPLHWSGATSGVRVHVHVMGPKCGQVTWQSRGMDDSVVMHNVTFDAATGYAQHTFECLQCVLTRTSAVDVLLDASCGTPLVQTFAVSSRGAVTAAAFQSSKAVLSVAVAMMHTLDIKSEATSSVTTRGFVVSPAYEPGPANDDAGTLRLRIALPLNPYFVRIQVTAATTLAELASSIIGLSGLIGFVGALFAQTERLIDASQLHAKRRPLARGPQAVETSRRLEQAAKAAGHAGPMFDKFHVSLLHRKAIDPVGARPYPAVLAAAENVMLCESSAGKIIAQQEPAAPPNPPTRRRPAQL